MLLKTEHLFIFLKEQNSETKKTIEQRHTIETKFTPHSKLPRSFQ